MNTKDTMHNLVLLFKSLSDKLTKNAQPKEIECSILTIVYNNFKFANKSTSIVTNLFNIKV